MILLAQFSVLPELFLKLKDDVQICAYLMFGTYHHITWITKGKILESMCNETDYKPGAGTYFDQLQSAHPGLVPQFSRRIKSARIWSDQVMVDPFGNLVNVHIMRSKIQE